MRRSYWSEVHHRAIREAMHALSLDEGARGVITIIVAVTAIGVIWITGNPGEAGGELLIRIAVTATIMLLFPFIYFWRFVTIPPRLHEEGATQVQSLENKLAEITAPRIRVLLVPPENGVHSYPCTDGSLSRYVQFTVTPAADTPLVDCEARLESVERLNPDGTLTELVEEHIHCKWSNYPLLKIDIRPKVQHRANLFFVNDRNENELHVETAPMKIRLPTEIQTKGDYRVRVNVSAKDAPTYTASFLFHWGGFDDITLTPEA